MININVNKFLNNYNIQVNDSVKKNCILSVYASFAIKFNVL